MEYGQPALTLKNDKGQVVIYRPRPDVVVVVSSGFLTTDLWTRQVPFYEKVFRDVPSLHLFRDAGEVRSFEPAYREGQQQFGKLHKSRFSEIVFHQRSALLAMAINAGALFTGANIVAVNRETFDRKLGELLAKQAA
ncbi:MAG: hypothetical protein ACOZQL_08425 [Myxococcota bacterium]